MLIGTDVVGNQYQTQSATLFISNSPPTLNLDYDYKDSYCAAVNQTFIYYLGTMMFSDFDGNDLTYYA